MRSKALFNQYFVLPLAFLVLLSLACQALTGQPSPSPKSQETTVGSTILPDTGTVTTIPEAMPSPMAVSTATLPESTLTPTDTPVAQSEPPTGRDILVNFGGVKFTIPDGVAGSVRSEFTPGTPLSADIPPFGQYPNHLVFYFDGYAIAEHFHPVRIEIYPTALLSRYNPAVNEILADVKNVISSDGFDLPTLPFLPIMNAAQVFHARGGALDFETGKGYRFLTVYSQGYGPIANYDLFYAYQGLSADGNYLVAAYLPVNVPILPVDRNSTDVPAGGIPFVDPTNTDPSGMETYLKQVTQALNGLQPGDFTPNLAKLDAMMGSLRIDIVNGLIPNCPALLQPNTRAYVSLNPPTRNRLRAGPGTEEQVVGLMEPGTVVQISSGPVCADGLVFWNVYAPDLDISGWTAESDFTEQWLLPCPQDGNCPPDWVR